MAEQLWMLMGMMVAVVRVDNSCWHRIGGAGSKAGGWMGLVAHASYGGFFKCGYGEEVASCDLRPVDDCRGSG